MACWKNARLQRIYCPFSNCQLIKPRIAQNHHSMRVRSHLKAIKESEQVPIQQNMLSGFLNLSSAPYSSYIPLPSTPLHKIDPRIKQLGIVFLLFMMTSSNVYGQATIATWLILFTLLNTPWKIAKQTLVPLLAMCVLYFSLAAAFSDGSPPGLQSHIPSNNLQNIPQITPKPYKYVIFKFGLINVTKKSIRLGVTGVSLFFVALQSASLCLITTSPEQLAGSLRQLLWPFRSIGVPVEEIGFCLLLSIRFLKTIFEELRNLALGVAVRGVDWNRLGTMGSINLFLTTIAQLFRKLFQTSENVSQALVIRGFIGPENHHLYLMGNNDPSWKANIMAILVLGLLAFGVFKLS